MYQLFEREINQAVETNNESLPVIHMLDLLVKTTEWMLVPAATPQQPATPTQEATAGTPPTTPTTPTTPSTTSTPTSLQQRCTDIIHHWQFKSSLLDNAITLFNFPQLSYYDHLLVRFNRVLEIVCTLDRSFLEQLLSGIHDQLSREDEHLPASVIAHSAGSMESMHRRRLMQREMYDRTNDESEEAHAYHASTAYNGFLITLINFVLNSPALTSPSSPSPSASPAPPAPETSFAPTVIDIAVLTTRNAYVQQRQPYAIKQHQNLQISVLQYLIQLQQRSQQTQQPPETHAQPLAQATSFTQALDLLRKIWDSPQHGPILRENRSLDGLVTVLLAEGYFLLDAHPPAVETIALFYAHSSKHLAPAAKEKLLHALGERTARIVNSCKREKQTQGNWNFDSLLGLLQVSAFYRHLFLAPPAQFLLSNLLSFRLLRSLSFALQPASPLSARISPYH